MCSKFMNTHIVMCKEHALEFLKLPVTVTKLVALAMLPMLWGTSGIPIMRLRSQVTHLCPHCVTPVYPCECAWCRIVFFFLPGWPCLTFLSVAHLRRSEQVCGRYAFEVPTHGNTHRHAGHMLAPSLSSEHSCVVLGPDSSPANWWITVDAK